MGAHHASHPSAGWVPGLVGSMAEWCPSAPQSIPLPPAQLPGPMLSLPRATFSGHPAIPTAAGVASAVETRRRTQPAARCHRDPGSAALGLLLNKGHPVILARAAGSAQKPGKLNDIIWVPLTDGISTQTPSAGLSAKEKRVAGEQNEGVEKHLQFWGAPVTAEPLVKGASPPFSHATCVHKMAPPNGRAIPHAGVPSAWFVVGGRLHPSPGQAAVPQDAVPSRLALQSTSKLSPSLSCLLSPFLPATHPCRVMPITWTPTSSLTWDSPTQPKPSAPSRDPSSISALPGLKPGGMVHREYYLHLLLLRAGCLITLCRDTVEERKASSHTKHPSGVPQERTCKGTRTL